MSYFAKHNVLAWVIIILLVLLISVAGTILFNIEKGKKMHDGLRPEMFKDEKFLKDKLSLNDEQVKKFQEINITQEDFRRQMTGNMRKERKKIDSMLMLDNPDTGQIKSVITEITSLQSKMIEEHINTYLRMKKICNPDQQKKLSDIFKQMLIERPRKGRFMRHEKEK